MTPECVMWASAPPSCLGGDLLAGDLLDHLRAGDEHLGLAGLDDEVGQRRASRPRRRRRARR